MDTMEDVPTTLGRYRVLSHLGVGEVGRLLLGADDADRYVVLTLASPELVTAPGFRERFRHEIRRAALAPTWLAAPVLDADPDADLAWLATAYVAGQTLSAYVADHGPMSGAGVEELAVRLAAGLAALHGAGLSHGDLGPSHVVLAEDGPRLTGLGMTRVASGAPDAGPPGDMGWFGALVVFAAMGRSPAAAADTGSLTGALRDVAQACMAADPITRPTAAQVRDRLRGSSSTTTVVPTSAQQSAQQPSAQQSGLSPAATAPFAAVVPGMRPVVEPGPTHRRPGRRPPTAAVVAAAVLGAGIALAVVLLVAGGGGTAGDIAGGDTAGGGPAGTGAGTSPTSQVALTSDPASGAELIDATTDIRFGGDGARFATPSGNIACAMTTDVRCDVGERTWDLPAAPADCPLAFGTGAVLSGAGSGELSCVGDTVADPDLTVLGYGEAVEYEGVVCVSRETGLRCENRETGHGFAVSRAAYELF